jgi:hypothetical protein
MLREELIPPPTVAAVEQRDSVAAALMETSFAAA